MRTELAPGSACERRHNSENANKIMLEKRVRNSGHGAHRLPAHIQATSPACQAASRALSLVIARSQRHSPVVIAIRALQMQQDRLPAWHTIHQNDSGQLQRDLLIAIRNPQRHSQSQHDSEVWPRANLRSDLTL